VPSFGLNVMDNTSCPIVAGVPDVMKAAFTKEVDFFAQRGIEYLDPALTFAEMHLTAKRMFETWGPRLGVTEDESDHAHREAMRALAAFEADLQEKGRAILETVESENRPCILMVSPPVPLGPGAQPRHPEEFQVLGYPVLSGAQRPPGLRVLEALFPGRVRPRPAPARHQRRVAGELLGQQRSEGLGGEVRRSAPERRAARSVELQVRPRRADLRHRREHRLRQRDALSAALHDIDANKPGGSIKIRVKTFAHSLKLYQETLEDLAKKKSELELSVDKKRLELLRLKQVQLADRRQRDPDLERHIEHMAEKIRRYEAPVRKPEPPRDLVQLKKKSSDGSTVPVGV
jgi:hypothetical protein